MHNAMAVIPRLALFCSLLFASGCGDLDATGDTPSATVPVNLPAAVEGAETRLFRESTRCGAPASAPLAGVVGTGVEFSADHVEELSSPCAGSPNPGVEVDVENGSVIFDFSNIATAGRFPHAVFEGYMLNFARTCGDPIFTGATVDSEATSIDMGAVELRTHFDRLQVNLADVAYDQTSFLKIDLSWADVRCITDLAE